MEELEKLDWTEAQEIADYLLEIENPESEIDITENALVDKWNIDMDTFTEIANGIFQMIDFSISPLSCTVFAGISTGNTWLAKKDKHQQFLQAIVLWCTEGEKIPPNKKGFIRTITSDGKPEYDITISRPEARTLNFKIKE